MRKVNVCFTCTHILMPTDRGLYPDNDKNPPHTTPTLLHKGPSAPPAEYIEGLRQLGSLGFHSPLPLSLFHGQSLIVVSYAFRKCGGPCYWKFGLDGDLWFVSDRILEDIWFVVG